MNSQDNLRRTKTAIDTHGVKRACIFVLGMHRSGTSALTRVLAITGVQLPATLMGANNSNATGHWESEALVRFNDRFLKSVGSNWQDYQALDIRRLPIERRRDLKSEIGDLLAAEFEDAPLFVLKDPRICRLAPIYIEALKDARIEPHSVLIIRNPLEVAESLQRRDALSQSTAALLWLRHVLDSDAATRGRARAVISYESLLTDWRASLHRISENLNIAWPYAIDEIEGQVDRYIDQMQRHHTRATEDVILEPALRNWIGEAYEALLVLERSPDSKPALGILEGIRKEFDHAAPMLAQLKSEADCAIDETQRLTSVLAEREQDLTQLQTVLRDRDQAITQLEAKLSEREKELSALEGEVAALTGRSDDQAVRIKILEREKSAQLEAAYRSREALIQHFKSSTSWHLTAPLRFARLVVNRFALLPLRMRAAINRYRSRISFARR